jgi:hypothetical protein
MTTKKFRLRKILLNEISLVDFPAEKHSVVTVFKRADQPTTGGGGMADLEKMAAEMARASQTIENLTKRANDAEAQVEALTKRATDAEAKVVMLAKRATSGDPEEDDILLKAADPTVAAEIIKLRKQNVAAAKQLAEIAEAGEIAKAVTRVAQEFPNLPVKAADFGPILKRALGVLTAEDSTELVRVLKAADNAIVDATRSTGFGAPFIAKGSAEQEIEALAKEVAKAESVSFAKGYDLILQRNPALYTRYLAERGQAN